MQFVYPGFLWALTALSIPIILHLFYFRLYKKVFFSNLRFLREVKEETSARNRSAPLILISRILAMDFILAFAQPIPLKIKSKPESECQPLCDNLSMQSFGKDLSCLIRAGKKEIIMGGNPGPLCIMGMTLFA
jgi:hypothetical protein